MTPAEVSILLRAAAALSGYDIPAGLPPVAVEVTKQWMGQRACPAHPDKCHILGLYDDKNVVYYVEGLRWQVADLVVVHELTHYLQHHSGRFSLTSCVDTEKREREAYQVQQVYAWRHNQMAPSMVPYAGCTYDDSTKPPLE